MAKNLSMDTKVAAPSKKPSMGKGTSQPITGKLAGMTSMGNGSSVGQGVKTAPSNPITGKAKAGTSMGNGGIIDGFAR